MYKYNLFALVQHLGDIDTGHYKAYCRHRDQVHYFKIVVSS
jgi:hypothetical protein